ncbi:Gastrula zinc finger, partial [Paramuricea clavata]
MKQVKPTVKSSVSINLKKPKPVKLRKPGKQMKEGKLQPPMQHYEEREIDPFSTDLQKPKYRKIETVVNTYRSTGTANLKQTSCKRNTGEGDEENGWFKIDGNIEVRMSKEIGNGKTSKDSVYFKSKTGTITNFENIESTAAANQQLILLRIEAFLNLGSNRRIMNIESHYVNIAMYKPLKGSSYIKLPQDISNSMSGLINIRNDDALCFLWCHVRHHRPKKNNATYITNKDVEYGDGLDYEGIKFPVKVGDIGKIEKKNKINITMLGYKGKKRFYPIRISKEKYEDHMELLLLGDGKGKLHYVLIKDVNRLLCSVNNKKTKKHFCLNCFHNCESEESLAKHKETCSLVNGVQAVKLPKEGTKIKFKNHKNQLPAPFVIYADFESLLVSDRDREMDDTVNESYTNRYQTRHACSFGLKRVCHYDDYQSGEYTSYVEKDAAYRFLKAVIKETEMCKQIMYSKFKKPMTITDEQESEFQAATECHICCGKMEGDDKVRDHYHVTGKYRGAAHNKCNLNNKLSWKIPVVFHNLRGYDSHLIMQEIGNFGLEINVIPNNMEKYLSFTLGKHLVFIDSIQFMASSLESLASFLPKEEFHLVGQRWQGEDFDLVTQKGIFPYEFLSSAKKLKTKQLPEKKDFYSTLYESEVSDEDYERARRVWKHFGMKTMKDYHDVYLETDVLLLADVFENFRKTCLKNYGLDPAHYVSAPGLSWDAFLK